MLSIRIYYRRERSSGDDVCDLCPIAGCCKVYKSQSRHSMASGEASSTVVAAARAKTEAYLPQIDAARKNTVSKTDLSGAVTYQKHYVGEC